jgi:hypothetical protein
MTTTKERRRVAQDILEALEQLDRGELDQIARRVRRLRVAKPTTDALLREDELLKVIRRKKPRELRIRYGELIAKRQTDALTPDEYGELLRLSDQAEAFNVRWLEALAELSKIRNTTLPLLIHDLGIQVQSGA